MSRCVSIFLVINALVAGVCLGTPLNSEHKTDNDHFHPRRSEIYSKATNDVEYEDTAHWIKDAQDTLAKKLTLEDKKVQAKNVIFFLGDGMSVPTLSAARVLKGQLEKMPFGEEAELFLESFPNVGVSKTFCTDSQVADSACSATAYLCGTKANIATIGVSSDVKLGDCVAQMNPANHVSSVLAWAQAAGKSTGVVTTTRVTHASPAGTYAHIADRDWESDANIKSDGLDPAQCDDIAKQLVTKEPGMNINVILGGGRKEFLTVNDQDPETGTGGLRNDENLITKWQDMKNGQKASYVWNRQGFEAVNPDETDYLLGLFEADHMQYAVDSREDPSLANLTRKAIEILRKNNNGYFLFVEGGRIDHAHHDNQAQKSLTEVIEFDEAIRTAAEMTSEDDTLILVTADHAHVFSFAGYPVRGNPILGYGTDMADDGLPYPTLSYANGPGYRHASVNGGDRYDISRDDSYDPAYKQIATAPLGSETHGGDDVLIYSRGPHSHLLRGNVQQSYIPHAVAYASCTGNGAQFCPSSP